MIGFEGMDENIMKYKSILPHCAGKKVLDYGCGIGLGSYILSHYSDQVYGYDPNKDAIEEARKKFGEKTNLSFIDRQDNSGYRLIDIIAFVDVIEYMEKDEAKKTLEEFSLLGCDLICTTPNGDIIYQPSPSTTIMERRVQIRHYSELDLFDLFQRYYSFVDITGHLRDLRLNHFTGYTVFASNRIEWNHQKIGTDIAALCK